LAFFDPALSADTLREMSKNIKQQKGSKNQEKRAQVDPAKAADFKLENFVTKNTMLFFAILGLNSTFLDVDPTQWLQRQDYRQGQEVVKNLQVVNDCAERGVALIEEFNSILTKQEEQKQFLLQVVTEHRRQFPDCAKSTLSASSSTT
jgi:hypothetical protein